MPEAVTTTTTELGDSRVRVDVEVDPAAVEREVENAARQLGRDLKIAGFRKGKVPPQVVLQRVGREAVLDEAVRRALPNWYEKALNDARLATVGDPKLDLGDLPDKGSPLTFSIEVGVRPPAKLGDYKGLEVGRREPEVAKEDVDAEVERLRDSLASLENGRARRPRVATSWCWTTSAASTASRSRAARGAETCWSSARVASCRASRSSSRARAPARSARSRSPSRTTIRPSTSRARRRCSPPPSRRSRRSACRTLDDDFASEAGGFDSLDELRADIESKLCEGRGAGDRGGVPRGGRGRRGGRLEDRPPQGAHPLEGPRDVARDRAPAPAPGHRPAALPRARRQDRGGARRRGRARGRARAEARGGAGRDRRGRADRGERRRGATRRCAPPPSAAEARRRTRRRCGDRSSAPRSRAGTRRCERTSRCARPSTCWWRPRSRSRVDQAQARDKLWTPDKESEERASEIWTPGS